MRSEQVEWIDIKEKQPENHQSVIIHIGWVYPNFENVKVAWYERSQHLFYTDSPTMDEIHRGFIPQELVRHWMPIPMMEGEGMKTDFSMSTEPLAKVKDIEEE